jgi:hypothetical protein
MRPVAHTLALLLCGVLAVAACDQLTTVAPPDGDVFDAPVEGLSDAEMAAFARGDAEFERQFAPNTGLGPIFNDVSCATCHSGDGRGRSVVPRSRTRQSPARNPKYCRREFPFRCGFRPRCSVVA